MRAARLAACATSLLLAACGRGESAEDTSASMPALEFGRSQVRVASATDTIPLTVELARTPEQKQLGLMERRSLGERAGMLFLYDSTQSPQSGFWMYRTRIPLDIAFIDSAGTIRTIQTMQPCVSDLAGACPAYPAGAPYRAALEMSEGFFAKHRIGVGDRVILGDTAR